MGKYKRYFIENSYVFVTVVTNNRSPILINNIELLRASFKTCNYKFEITSAVILPDHFHAIIKPDYIKEFPSIIKSIKYYFSKNTNIEVDNKTKTQLHRKEKGIWQRRYYDHLIKSENDFNTHLDYIHYNPVKHGYVLAPKDWGYSSFGKFCRDGWYEENWCNFNDGNKITKLELD